MTEDARFEDAGGGPLRLAAETEADLQVIASLCQDAVFPTTEMTYQPRDNRFAILMNRFRWEENAQRPERVQSVLAFDGVRSVRSNGIDRKDADQVLSLLTIEAQISDDLATLTLVLAGDGAIELTADVLSVTLADVTRPYYAPSGHIPDHKA